MVDDNWVCFENGERERIRSGHIVFTHGKYAGQLLSEMDDRWYLEFMHRRGVDTGDHFMVKCAEVRLQELS